MKFFGINWTAKRWFLLMILWTGIEGFNILLDTPLWWIVISGIVLGFYALGFGWSVAKEEDNRSHD